MKTTIELARKAGGDDWDLFKDFMPEIERLVALVRADERSVEREACAKVCDEQADELYESKAHHKCAEYLAEQIRARGNT